MQLKYTTEVIKNSDGVPCRVLDTRNLDFSAAARGRKTSETLVRRAQGGERIEARNSEGKTESVYIAQEGDAIFINTHNVKDMYVPGDADGIRLKFKDLVSKSYEITRNDNGQDCVFVKSTKTAQLLHQIIQEPTCIKNAWGKNQHQFLFSGATLKKDDAGNITGIDKEAFDATWEIVPFPLDTLKPPKPGHQ